MRKMKLLKSVANFATALPATPPVKSATAQKVPGAWLHACISCKETMRWAQYQVYDLQISS